MFTFAVVKLMWNFLCDMWVNQHVMADEERQIIIQNYINYGNYRFSQMDTRQ